MEAHNQYKIASEKKIYVNAENLYVCDEGIFWQAKQGEWLPISGIERDSQGIYLTKLGISWSYEVCKTCGKRYKSRPSECDVCGGTEFELEYEDIWDRRT